MAILSMPMILILVGGIVLVGLFLFGIIKRN